MSVFSLVILAATCACLTQGQGFLSLLGGGAGAGGPLGGALGRRFMSRAHLPYQSEIGEDPGKYRQLPIGRFAPRNTTNPLAPFFRNPQLMRLLMSIELEPQANAGGLGGLGGMAGLAGGRRNAYMQAIMRALTAQ